MALSLSFLGQRRWQMSLVLMVTFFVGFLDRLNITFALPLMAAEFGWGESETQSYGSLLMGLFYGAYGLANILLTPLANKLGPRRSLVIIVILWSAFTAMGAWFSQWLTLLLASRVLLGLSEGVHIPMMTQLIKSWFPLEERSRANSTVMAGLFLAVLLAPPMLVPLMAAWGWRMGFLMLAVIGLLVSLPLVLRFVHNSPGQHPAIGAVELELTQAGRRREALEEGASMSWGALFATPRFLLWGLIGVINNVVALGFTSWLPTYFTTVRGIPFDEITWLVAAPYAFSLLGLAVWATLGDRFGIRAGLAALGFAVAACLIYVALNAHSIAVVVVCMSASVFMISAFNATEYAMVQRIVPLDKFAPAMGVYNGLATMLGGGLGPLILSPMIGNGEGVWVISAIALANACLLLLAWRVIRY